MASIYTTRVSAQTLYATDEYSGSDSDVGSSEVYSSSIDLATNNYVGLMIYIYATFVVSPTDDLEWKVYGFHSTSFDTDQVPQIQGTLEAVDNGEKISQPIFITDVNAVRVGLKSSGTTDTIDAKVVAVPFYYTSA